MPTFDEDLRRRLAGAAEWPEERDDLTAAIARRKGRRARARRIGAVVVVIAVLALAGGGFLFIDRTDGTTPQPASPSVGNGAMVVSRDDSMGTHLYVLPASRMDLDPTDGAIPDAGKQSPVTGAGAGSEILPVISPDGSQIAFLRCLGDRCPWKVVVMRLDGSDERILPDPYPSDPNSLAWSPDGAWLAIADTDGAVWLTHPDGSALHRVAPSRMPVVDDVAWSADGEQLIVSGAPSTGGQPDLWSVDVDGTNLVNLTNTPAVAEGQPAAAPDGTGIVYLARGDIDRIPVGGGDPEQLVGAPGAQDGAVLARPAYSPDGAYLTFVIMDPVTSTVYALPQGTTSAFPLTPGSTYAWQPIPPGTAVPPDLDTLGLSFSVCNVSTMPVTSDLGPGTAAVFTRENDDGSCPDHGHGYTAVGVDTDGDGRLDATYGPLEDCYLSCAAFAAPDVTNDGTSEVTVSNAGADGFGVWLFRFEASPPSIAPVLHSGGPFEFTWLDTATHAAGARCQPADDGSPTMIVAEIEKDPVPAQVTEKTFVIDGLDAVPVGTHGFEVPLDQAPLPGSTLCDAPIQVPDARFG